MKTAREAFFESYHNDIKNQDEKSELINNQHKEIIENIINTIEKEIEKAIKNGHYSISGRLDKIFPNYKKYKNHIDIINEVFRQFRTMKYHIELYSNFETSFFFEIMGYYISWSTSYI
jgi:dihydropteroate synthase